MAPMSAELIEVRNFVKEFKFNLAVKLLTSPQARVQLRFALCVSPLSGTRVTAGQAPCGHEGYRCRGGVREATGLVRRRQGRKTLAGLPQRFRGASCQVECALRFLNGTLVVCPQ